VEWHQRLDSSQRRDNRPEERTRGERLDKTEVKKTRFSLGFLVHLEERRANLLEGAAVGSRVLERTAADLTAAMAADLQSDAISSCFLLLARKRARLMETAN